MFLGKCFAGAGFEVFFEGISSIFIGESQVGYEDNRSSGFCINVFTFVVSVNPFFQIRGVSGIISTVRTF